MRIRVRLRMRALALATLGLLLTQSAVVQLVRRDAPGSSPPLLKPRGTLLASQPRFGLHGGLYFSDPPLDRFRSGFGGLLRVGLDDQHELFVSAGNP